MRGAIAADDARAIEREQHRQVLQRDVVDELVVGALQEGGIDGDDGAQAFAGEARRERHGVLFGDGDVEIARAGISSSTRRGRSLRASRA